MRLIDHDQIEMPDTEIDGPGRWKTMRLHPHEFIRRFLMHVLTWCILMTTYPRC